MHEASIYFFSVIQRTSDEVATNNESDDYRSFLKQEESLNAAQDISVDQLSSNGFSDSDEELDTATDNEPMEVEYDTSDPEWDPSQEIEPKRMQPTPPAGSKDEVVLNASGSSGRRPGDVQRKPPLPRIFKSNKHSEEERSPGR